MVRYTPILHLEKQKTLSSRTGRRNIVPSAVESRLNRLRFFFKWLPQPAQSQAFPKGSIDRESCESYYCYMSVPLEKKIRWEMITVGQYQENCYLIWLDGSQSCLVVDPGDEADRIIKVMQGYQIRPEVILLTHSHCDHIGAVGELKSSFDIPLLIGKGEEQMLSDPQLNLSEFLASPIVAPSPDRVVEAGEILTFAGINLMVASTPGHSIASVSYLVPSGSLAISGDVLFAGSIGRTDLPGGDFETLMRSIDRELLSLPDGTLVLPGHGPTTTVGRERRTNPFVLRRHFG